MPSPQYSDRSFEFSHHREFEGGGVIASTARPDFSCVQNCTLTFFFLTEPLAGSGPRVMYGTRVYRVFPGTDSAEPPEAE